MAADGRRPRLKVFLGDVTPKNTEQVRMLNLSMFPVSYNDKFYKEMPSLGEFAKLDVLVGAVCSRLEPLDDGKRRCCILTLGVLLPYRRMGVGEMLLHHLLEQCAKEPDIAEMYLHVQTSNDEARRFYERFGFAETGVIENYYKRVEPASCWILSRSLV